MRDLQHGQAVHVAACRVRDACARARKILDNNKMVIIACTSMCYRVQCHMLSHAMLISAEFGCNEYCQTLFGGRHILAGGRRHIGRRGHGRRVRHGFQLAPHIAKGSRGQRFEFALDFFQQIIARERFVALERQETYL